MGPGAEVVGVVGEEQARIAAAESRRRAGKRCCKRQSLLKLCPVSTARAARAQAAAVIQQRTSPASPAAGAAASGSDGAAAAYSAPVGDALAAVLFMSAQYDHPQVGAGRADQWGRAAQMNEAVGRGLCVCVRACLGAWEAAEQVVGEGFFACAPAFLAFGLACGVTRGYVKRPPAHL